MLAAGERNPTLRVVADQRGCPTSAPDLAVAILGIVERLAEGGWQDRYAGIFHAAGNGETTWHGLATATFFEEPPRIMALRSPVVDPVALRH